jgi:uncharacterized membrane protein HdeD (DUF308 family)
VSSAAAPQVGGSMGVPETREAARAIANMWWLWLVAGVAWIVAALVILQFDQASITTIGIIIGCMFAFAGVQQVVLAFTVDSGWRWLFGAFGIIFLACAVICFVNPKNTFAGMADILGFLFLTVGVWWTIRAFMEREANSIWWLGLIAGILMIIMAFWTSGQFFLQRAYTLLVFAGIWAMMQGVTDIFRAFAMRKIRDEI